MEKNKGSALTEEEKKELEHRVEYAKVWLEKFAGEEAKIRIVDKPDWGNVGNAVKKALADYSGFLDLSEAEQTEKIRLVCAENGAGVQDFFKAAYKIFIA